MICIYIYITEKGAIFLLKFLLKQNFNFSMFAWSILQLWYWYNYMENILEIWLDIMTVT